MAEGLLTVDVTNPAAVTRTDTKVHADSVFDVSLVGTSFLAVLAESNVYLYDITDGAKPKLVTEYALAGPTGASNKIAVDGDYLYLNDGANKLLILKMSH